MDDSRAIVDGELASNYRFFGVAITEIAGATVERGGWNDDDTRSVHSTQSWTMRGGMAQNGVPNGVFTSYGYNGAIFNFVSHRTILLGY
ncbi:hypothetical protein FWG76_01475 [Candidatus Saccharibacteria bacterium]|nr:hypothetical protein [Candidatus Saccharibacteria bacterium]